MLSPSMATKISQIIITPPAETGDVEWTSSLARLLSRGSKNVPLIFLEVQLKDQD